MTLTASVKNVADNTTPIINMIEKALLGRRKVVEMATCTFLAGGHLLIEDVPGVGKTTLARAMARTIGGEFRRIQFTSDLLPSDITGVSVWNPSEGEFVFKPGPIFGNIVLSDEINRAPPKTQSALLEAMSERQISVNGVPRPLPDPFMVVATQNVQEQHGTYPLPESQLDRFMMSLSMGYPDPDEERKVISRPTLDDPVDTLSPAVDGPALASMREQVDRVRVSDGVTDYMMSIIAATRTTSTLSLGVAPRGGMALHRAIRALAVIRGRDYCLIDDVKELAVPVLAHRVVSAGNHGMGVDDRTSAAAAIKELVDSTEVPL